MFDLTPSERRGAIVLLVLFALGAVWDLTHTRPVAAPPVAGVDEVEVQTGGPPPVGAPASRARAPDAEAPLELNSAGAAELDRLPGIGPVLARRILEQRTAQGGFRSVEELLAVHGIGPRLFARLHPLVRVAAPRPVPAADTVHNARRSRG